MVDIGPYHIILLRRAGLVIPRREGKFIFYALADDSVLALLAALRRVAEAGLAEIDRIVGDYFAGRDDLEPVSRAECRAAGARARLELA